MTAKPDAGNVDNMTPKNDSMTSENDSMPSNDSNDDNMSSGNETMTSEPEVLPEENGTFESVGNGSLWININGSYVNGSVPNISASTSGGATVLVGTHFLQSLALFILTVFMISAAFV